MNSGLDFGYDVNWQHTPVRHRFDCRGLEGNTIEFWITVGRNTHLFIRGSVFEASEDYVTLSIAGDFKTYMYDEMVPEESIIRA